jgi:hypothetical protein
MRDDGTTMMEAVQASETLVNSYQSTRRYNTEENHIQILYLTYFKIQSKFYLTVGLNAVADTC